MLIVYFVFFSLFFTFFLLIYVLTISVFVLLNDSVMFFRHGLLSSLSEVSLK